MRNLVIFLLMILCARFYSTADAAIYSVTDLGPHVLPIKINDSGQILAQRTSEEGGDIKTFLVDDESIIPISAPDGYRVFARGLNNAGQVVGSGRKFGGRDHAFIWEAESGFRFLDPTRQVGSYAYSINDNGVVAAEVYGQGRLIYQDGKEEIIGHLGWPYGVPFALNSHQAAVGISALDSVGHQQHAFLWRDGKIMNIDVLASAPVASGFQEYVAARDINDKGDIVGHASVYLSKLTSSGNSLEDDNYGFFLEGSSGTLHLFPDTRFLGISTEGHAVGEMYFMDPPSGPDIWTAVVFRDGHLIDLNSELMITEPIHLAHALDINSRGQIIAVGWNGDPDSRKRYRHGFLLTPVPEPSTLIGCILAILLGSHLRLMKLRIRSTVRAE